MVPCGGEVMSALRSPITHKSNPPAQDGIYLSANALSHYEAVSRTHFWQTIEAWHINRFGTWNRHRGKMPYWLIMQTAIDNGVDPEWAYDWAEMGSHGTD